MQRSRFITVAQLRVAGLILAALAVVGVAVYKLGKAGKLFAKRYELVVYLPAASGLREGGSVTLAGQLVGTVKRIEFLPVDYDTTYGPAVTVGDVAITAPKAYGYPGYERSGRDGCYGGPEPRRRAHTARDQRNWL